MQKVGVIVQARMTSTRLPGKVLMEIGGNPLLEFLIKRLGDLSDDIDLIVATTKDKEDEKIIELCDLINVPCYRGSRENVLKRYVECAREFNIDVIVRVCADCPFIDPNGINELIIAYNKNSKADLVHNKHRDGYPLGTGAELITLASLEKSEEAANREDQKEHVVTYILENPDKFKVIRVYAPEYLRRPNYYLTVDYPDDLTLTRRIISSIEGNNKEKTPLRKIVELLDENQYIVTINSHLHEGFRE
jgi:spore coat polysaccharide biosynthesis protein SpsF